MRIFLLSDGKNPHTIKWVRSLAGQGVDVFVFSLAAFDKGLYSAFSNVACYSADRELAGNKLSYLTTLKALKMKIKEFRPTVVHAHYASSYGLLGALSGFKPFFISVWGTDVFEFPRKSFVHRMVLKFNLSRASRIFSTSHTMAREIRKYTARKIKVIPFGVNLSAFSPKLSSLGFFNEGDLVVGIVKTLEPKYGVEVLVRAFSVVKNKTSNPKLKLLIVGHGAQEMELKQLVDKLGIASVTHFAGWVSVEKIPDYHNAIDISVFPSICDESFGVAVVEASACEKPVIVSRRGGMPEVVAEDVTGLIVPSGDVNALADAIEKLVADPGLRRRLGKQGRARVVELYDWKENLSAMLESYKQVETNTWN